VIQCVLETAREQLPFEIDGNESRAGVDGFVARQEGLLQNIPSQILAMPFGSQQNADMKRVFLQPR
jgi:hypothetical protein